jgi:hypothetical protein
MINAQKALATSERSLLLKRLISAQTKTINQMMITITINQKTEPAVSMIKVFSSIPNLPISGTATYNAIKPYMSEEFLKKK